MIKQLLSITTITAFAVFTATAQNAIPNANFESWTGNDAASWDNLNDIPLSLGVGSCVKATAPADIHGGSAAIILTTKSILSNIAPGTAATGTIDFNTQQVTGGVSFNLLPDSLTGWYKYIPAGNDAGNIVGILFNANRDTIAVATFFPAGTVSTYTYFKTAFTYRLSETPTEALFVLASNGRTGGVANTKLYVDDLGLVYNPTVGVDEASADKIAVYPNPVSENLFVNMAGVQGANVSIFDITGKKVIQHNL
ncbi:MAG: T9SS type A sorting domain-containing protein, partial [Bacteroidia bacterium]